MTSTERETTYGADGLYAQPPSYCRKCDLDRPETYDDCCWAECECEARAAEKQAEDDQRWRECA